jgi:hypothetical protein
MSEKYVLSDYEVMQEVLAKCNLLMYRGETGSILWSDKGRTQPLKRGYVVSLVAETLEECEREASSENILDIINLLKER